MLATVTNWSWFLFCGFGCWGQCTHAKKKKKTLGGVFTESNKESIFIYFFLSQRWWKHQLNQLLNKSVMYFVPFYILYSISESNHKGLFWSKISLQKVWWLLLQFSPNLCGHICLVTLMHHCIAGHPKLSHDHLIATYILISRRVKYSLDCRSYWTKSPLM